MTFVKLVAGEVEHIRLHFDDVLSNWCVRERVVVLTGERSKSKWSPSWICQYRAVPFMAGWIACFVFLLIDDLEGSLCRFIPIGHAISGSPCPLFNSSFADWRPLIIAFHVHLNFGTVLFADRT